MEADIKLKRESNKQKMEFEQQLLKLKTEKDAIAKDLRLQV